MSQSISHLVQVQQEGRVRESVTMATDSELALMVFLEQKTSFPHLRVNKLRFYWFYFKEPVSHRYVVTSCLTDSSNWWPFTQLAVFCFFCFFIKSNHSVLSCGNLAINNWSGQNKHKTNFYSGKYKKVKIHFIRHYFRINAFKTGNKSRKFQQ